MKTTENLYIQYHNADKLGYFPTKNTNFKSLISDLVLDSSEKYEEAWIYTSKKTIWYSKAGICFLIVGKTENKVKNYYLWCHFKIENIEETDGDIFAGGRGKDWKNPVLLNHLNGFDSFKRFCGNFGIGFQKIDNHAFSKTLYSYLEEIKEKISVHEEIFVEKRIQELYSKIMLTLPEKRVKQIDVVLRNDRKIVNLLKQLVNYKCQFPNCESTILTEKGINYVEVAHITPFSKGGKSVLGNLIVLCPNHHKEFDLGKKEIFKDNTEIISGKLNDKEFEINLFNNFSYRIK